MLQGHIEKHTTPGVHNKHVPGVVCILDMVLEHNYLI